MNNLTVKSSNKTLKLDFRSSYQNVDRAVETILDYVKKESILVNHFELNVVLRELLTNAVRHGNKNDPDKKVKCWLTFEKSDFKFTIKDEGKGFIPSKEMDQKSCELTPHGMGLTIITSLGYNMEYNENDKSLKVYKSNGK